MPPRKGAPSINTLSPPETGLQSGPRSPGSSTSSFPRSVSPSTGFTQFFTKPTKWFARSNSSGAIPGRSSISSNEPRSSSSSARKPKISHPTDPRPILDQLRPEPGTTYIPTASRSVLDLSLARTATAFDHFPASNAARNPASPMRSPSRGLGDLRNISRKPWSKSADDLGKLSSAPALSRIDTSFQNKLHDYRGNTIPSCTTPTSHSPQGSISYPFPSITTTSVETETPSSSPPQRSGILTSGSSPADANTPPLTPNGHVHSRSHSFTPRLPSKLSSPKLGLAQPSPKRKGSAPSPSDVEPTKELKLPSGSLGSGPSTRAAFPFGFGGSSASGPNPLDKPGASSNLLAPPTIVEPGGSPEMKSEKRTSQVIYHSGFINRFTDFSPAALNMQVMPGGLMFSKGWKPFKLVLKGSKLYFYKPPGDRSAAVKELFPTELVVVLEEEGISDQVLEPPKEELFGTPRTAKGKERDEGRRQRTFWGSSTHPGLVTGTSGAESGSFEALIHETVFGTTFPKVQVVANEEKEPCPEWETFALSVIYGLPSTIGQARFEPELRRCCTMFIEGAGDSENARKRVQWIMEQYLTFYTSPTDSIAWESWRQSTIPDFPSDFVASSKPSRPSSLATANSLVANLEATFAKQPSNSLTSPNVGTFSPRPENDDRITSLLDALGDTSGGMRRERSKAQAPVVKPWHIALENSGLTRELLFGLDTQLIACSLFVFNQRSLQQLPDVVPATACLAAELDAEADISDGLSPVSAFVPFLGSDEHPHWLTKLVLLQVLISDSPNSSQYGSLHGLSMDERHGPPRSYSRSDVISCWARIGELCRRTGDECSWKAIFAALCSHPLARLDKVWKRVDHDALRLVQSWVYPHDRGAPATVTDVKHIPWVGDRVAQIKDSLGSAQGHEGAEWNVAPLTHAWESFVALKRDFALASKLLSDSASDEPEDVEILVNLWRKTSQQGNAVPGIAAKFKRVDQFMSLSMAAEPKRRGLFEPYYWARPQHSFHPLTPLLFPESLPTVAFINRSFLQRGRLESTASSITLQELQQIRERAATQDMASRGNSDPTKVGGLDLGGTVIVVYDGELMLLVQAGDPMASHPSSRAPSRPPSSVVDPPITPTTDKSVSRNPSVRVKPGSKGLERKPSKLRRSSLPILSRKPSFEPADIASERPIRVVIKAGTIDRLVTVLVEGLHGVSVSVADDNGEMPLNDHKTRELRVDMNDFARIWWSTFRSFMTPHVFFELLRKKYLSAQINSQAAPAGEIATVVRARTEVLETINRWIHEGGGAQDALDDPQLLSSFISFFRHPTDHEPPEAVASDFNVHAGFGTINDNRKAVYASFTAQIMRPTVRAVPDPVTESSNPASYSSDPPDIDNIEPEELVGNLDAMAAATFRNVTQEDLFVSADILEVQSADRTGWFPTHEPSAISDEVEIQSIHSHLQDVEPSAMISDLGQDSVYRLLPPAVRGCIRAFLILRKWVVSKLVTQKLGLRARQARMELILRSIEVCRLRNAEPTLADSLVGERPCIRSFVESVLVSAALSVESRTYHRAWQALAAARGATCDSMSALLTKSSGTPHVVKDPLTVDMGWLLERIVEIISLPDVVEQDGLSLVNLDKRRSLYTLLTTSSPNGSRRPRHREVNRRDFDRLNRIETELNEVHLDLRLIREDAYREVAQCSTALVRKQPRPFQAIVAQQQEKNKRDRSLRDKLSKEKRQEQHRQDKREEYLNKAMQTRRPYPPAAKQHRNKKSVSSAFLHFMRPISSAFLSETLSPTAKRTPAELDFAPTHKPAMVLSIVDARVQAFINNERSFTFQIDTEDGGHYLLQALDRTDMKKWIETIERVSKMAAKRRLTYLGHNSKMPMSDHLFTTGAAPRDPRAVFGVELETILLRQSSDDSIAPGTIPRVVERLIEEVESRGLTEVGIYRLAGAHSEVNGLKDALNRGEWPIDRFTDINTVCDLLKSWFRVLPGGMFPDASRMKLMDAANQTDVDLDKKLANLRDVVHELPRIHFDLLKRLIEHLDKVTDFEENNQMTAESLATVFSPNLLRSADDDIGFFFANMGNAHRATKMLITHSHIIFNDHEPDLDVDHDGESDDDEEEYEHFDAPIPEEDEEEAEMLSAGHGDGNIDEDEDEGQVIVAPDPPILDFEVPSPVDFTIPLSTPA
ncbi:hypothetical protein BDY19DRAFT_887550 [Irpex rosettiformis]|uniref:Uncharacterized protein n=1 Tax=Irpex rosettiformis TaxID=378272 RepID=A0ACB8U9H2_9APHY|nr:hypothetical protein BDY19DRAFT_887550 [Irpex rosettiformis]